MFIVALGGIVSEAAAIAFLAQLSQSMYIIGHKGCGSGEGLGWNHVGIYLSTFSLRCASVAHPTSLETEIKNKTDLSACDERAAYVHTDLI